MSDRTWPAQRSVLVAASAPADVRLITNALAEIGFRHYVAEDGVDSMQALCRRPNSYAALVIGERVGRVSGLTLCGLARDAGCRLPILLLTRDDQRSTAERAARLRLSLLWQPISSERVARTLMAMLPRRPCGWAGRASACAAESDTVWRRRGEFQGRRTRTS